jgi:heme peroxidase
MGHPDFPSQPPAAVDTGHYGRMFRATARPVALSEEDGLRRLGAAMMDSVPSDKFGTFAGMTYFGQFIDHDLTLDNTKLEERNVEPNQVPNLHAARLDLKLVYGAGLADSNLYDGDRLKIGATGPIPETEFRGGTLRDIGRNDQKEPLWADPDHRNLENLMVMQIHVLFMQFHNAALNQINDEAFQGLPLEGTAFERTQQLVRWHYQWLVRNYFLPAVGQHQVVQDVWREPRIKWAEKGLFIPAEFSLAAFRFGHSMVRDSYSVNCHHRDVPLVGLMGQDRKLGPLGEDWLFEWGRLFPGLRHSTGRMAPSSAINTSLVPALHQLDDPTKRLHNPPSATETQPHLSARTLLRGARASLPTGQEVARILVDQGLLETNQVLTGPQLAARVDSTNDNSGELLTEIAMLDRTPLYYYLLKEAEVHGFENHTLGPVGTRMVAEVIERVLRADPKSYLNAVGIDWNLPDWRFADGTWGKINSITRLVQMLGDELPQGCPATIPSRLPGLGAQLVRRIGRVGRTLGFS